ncbi:MAG: chorismate mutase [Eubacteriales bacterium]|nr:chorismate mutase [Eubacteriales bacterium]
MDLDEVRSKIDETDVKIRELLALRMELSAAAAAAKASSGKATLDSSREEAILNKTRESSPPDTAEYLVNIYKEILKQSRAYQEALRTR